MRTYVPEALCLSAPASSTPPPRGGSFSLPAGSAVTTSSVTQVLMATCCHSSGGQEDSLDAALELALELLPRRSSSAESDAVSASLTSLSSSSAAPALAIPDLPTLRTVLTLMPATARLMPCFLAAAGLTRSARAATTQRRTRRLLLLLLFLNERGVSDMAWRSCGLCLWGNACDGEGSKGLKEAR